MFLVFDDRPSAGHCRRWRLARAHRALDWSHSGRGHPGAEAAVVL